MSQDDGVYNEESLSEIMVKAVMSLSQVANMRFIVETELFCEKKNREHQESMLPLLVFPVVQLYCSRSNYREW